MVECHKNELERSSECNSSKLRKNGHIFGKDEVWVVQVFG
jgi:hypothetical protein